MLRLPKTDFIIIIILLQGPVPFRFVYKTIVLKYFWVLSVMDRVI